MSLVLPCGVSKVINRIGRSRQFIAKYSLADIKSVQIMVEVQSRNNMSPGSYFLALSLPA